MSLFRPERRGAVASGSPTYNPFENPSTPLASVGFDNVWSTQYNDSGEVVTVDRSIAIPTVYRCVGLISTVLASCPIKVYRGSEKEDVTDNHNLLSVYNPDMTYTQFELKELIVSYLCLWGNSFVYKLRDQYSQKIIDLKPLYPELVEVKLDEDRNKIFEVKHLRSDGTIDQATKPDVFTEYEIMHIPGLGYNGLTGLSPVSLFAQTIGTTIAADRLAARFFSSGSQLGGIIKVKAPLRDQTQAEGIKNRWRLKNAGVGHAGDVAVLDAETDFQSITIPPNDLQFLESRRWETTEIARWFGIPPHLIGDVEKSTSWGTGIEQQNLGLVTYNLAGWTSRIEQRYTREIIDTRGRFAEFDLDRLMRGDTVERYQSYQSSAGGPWMTRNEVRQRENMQPIKNPEYDELLPPQGIGPMDDQQGPAGSSNNKQPAKPKSKPDQE